MPHLLRPMHTQLLTVTPVLFNQVALRLQLALQSMLAVSLLSIPVLFPRGLAYHGSRKRKPARTSRMRYPQGPSFRLSFKILRMYGTQTFSLQFNLRQAPVLQPRTPTIIKSALAIFKFLQ